MKVIRATALGMCFGVRDALHRAEELPDPSRVAIHGQLVHNPIVLRDLEERGFLSSEESDRRDVPERPVVLLTAHGVSDAEQSRLREAGKEIVDTTCPLVLRAHRAARDLEGQGFHVLVIGRPDHVEVRGIVGDLSSFDVLEAPDSVATYPSRRLGIVAQTTSSDRQISAIRTEVARRNPLAEIRYIDTVCRPTRERQRALEDLLLEADVVVVVGGRNSRNTGELVARCREAGIPAHHVEGPAELRSAWFRDAGTVGLTAGTSTLHATVDDVERALLALSEESEEVPRDPAPASVDILVESSLRAR